MKMGKEVMLISGGTSMTTAGVRKDGHIYCVWFDARGKAWRKAFPMEILVIVKPPTRKEREARRLQVEKEEAEQTLRVKAMVEEIMGPEEEEEAEARTS